VPTASPRVTQFTHLPQNQAGDEARDGHEEQRRHDRAEQQRRSDGYRNAEADTPPDRRRQSIGARLQSYHAKRDQYDTQDGEDRHANAQRLAHGLCGAVGNRRGATTDVGQELAAPSRTKARCIASDMRVARATAESSVGATTVRRVWRTWV